MLSRQIQAFLLHFSVKSGHFEANLFRLGDVNGIVLKKLGQAVDYPDIFPLLTKFQKNFPVFPS